MFLVVLAWTVLLVLLLLALALLPVALRVALLPVAPIPLPRTPDDFSMGGRPALDSRFLRPVLLDAARLDHPPPRL